MKSGSRIFAPRPFTTGLTLVLLAMLISLGLWQLRRADQKRALFDAFDSGAAATLRIASGTPPLPRYQHIEMQGRYDGSRQVLIDNMTDDGGRAGYFVITPFALSDGGFILVNRGWVPLGASRATLPAVAVDHDERTIKGRTDHLPVPGIHMGQPAPLAPPFPAVANFPTRDEIAHLLGATSWSRAADVVLLDRDQKDGYVRQWRAPGFPPLRHVAYAVQWFGLAAALIVIYLVTHLRAPKPGEAAK